MILGMVVEPLTRKQRIRRAAVLFPIAAAGVTFALWTMRMIPTVADEIGWPTPLVAFLLGVLVVGPLRIGGELLANRLLIAVDLPLLRFSAARPAKPSEHDSLSGREDAYR